eukprot:125491-Pelagomonas_calceolata.AAC.1
MSPSAPISGMCHQKKKGKEKTSQKAGCIKNGWMPGSNLALLIPVAASHLGAAVPTFPIAAQHLRATFLYIPKAPVATWHLGAPHKTQQLALGLRLMHFRPASLSLPG